MIKNDELNNLLSNFSKIVIFSGAGVSTNSEISDYKNGFEFYSNIFKDYFEPREILTSYMFNKNKPLFFEYILSLFDNLNNKKPNNSHYFVRDLGENLLGVITQNIDGLYDNIIPDDKLSYIHGKYNKFVCTKCKKNIDLKDTYLSKKGVLLSNCHNFVVKPNIVLYGENFDEKEVIKYKTWLKEADCIVVMGTELDINTHNINIGESNAVKILVNNNDVQLYKNSKSLYSFHNDVQHINWDYKFLGELNNII